MLLGTWKSSLASNRHNFIHVGSPFSVFRVLYFLHGFLFLSTSCACLETFASLSSTSSIQCSAATNVLFLAISMWSLMLTLYFCFFKPLSFSLAFLILLSFLLTLFSHKFVSVSWNLSSCMPRNFLKIFLKCGEHHFQRNTPTLGLGGSVPALYSAVF